MELKIQMLLLLHQNAVSALLLHAGWSLCHADDNLLLNIIKKRQADFFWKEGEKGKQI